MTNILLPSEILHKADNHYGAGYESMTEWKYYDITHRHHLICNPTSVERLDQICQLLKLGPSPQVLDIACGKAELLIMLAETFGAEGVGVDISPFFIADAEKKRRVRVPRANLEFLNLDAAEYRPYAPEPFDLAMCLGASWIYQGYRGTLVALKNMVRPDGLVMVGEPYWLKEPSEDYLASEDITEKTFNTHHGNVIAGEKEGLSFLYAVVSSQEDFDRYDGLQWYAAAEYARTNPEDPDVPEMTERVVKSREAYLRWGWDTLGWAIYLFRKPAL